MPPEEKAKELFMRFSSHTVHFNCARSCALIAANEVLDHVDMVGDEAAIPYWKEVKQEIEKL
jgi:hypothetical protein